jgi:hypothetical protein
VPPRIDRQPAAAAGGFNDRVEVLRPVGSVGVHLHEQGRAFGQPDAKRIYIRAADPELAFAMQHSHARVVKGQPVGDLTGAVRRGVVDHEHVMTQVADARDDPFEVLLLVEGRQDDEHLRRRGPALCEPPSGLHLRNLSRMT